MSFNDSLSRIIDALVGARGMTGNEISVANEQQKAGLAEAAMGFSIVGIGASAGGIKALQSFFEAMPSRTGLAFAVIVHLAPERHSELPSILAARTRMPVTQVNEPTPLEPDHVYVICHQQLELAGLGNR